MEIVIHIYHEPDETPVTLTAPTVDMAIEKLGAWERAQGKK